jgi:hypothetical protein
MAINRRRAASSKISSHKKIQGHKYEETFADLIEGDVIKGVQKGDVIDNLDRLYSVKSGKKWQIFLYGHDRIQSSTYLKCLLPALESFPEDPTIYFQDRIKCIAYKEEYIHKFGREKARTLSNEEVIRALGRNEYALSKEKLALANQNVCKRLTNTSFLRDFLSESIFNLQEVTFLAAKDSTYLQDGVFKTFERNEVLDIFSKNLTPATSQAGHVPEDFNVAGQKTLLRYGANSKNIVEIEIRNDSETHYRQVRFNMYSKDALTVLLQNLQNSVSFSPANGVTFFGEAVNLKSRAKN